MKYILDLYKLLGLTLFLSSCMEPIFETEDQYSDYTDNKLNDPNNGWPNGTFADDFNSWGAFSNENSDISIDTTVLVQNSLLNDISSVKLVGNSYLQSSDGWAGVYSYFSYIPGDSLIYTFYYMIPETLNILENSPAFHLQIRNRCVDSDNNAFIPTTIDEEYFIGNEELEFSIIADGSWRPITYKSAFSDTECEGQYFRLGLQEWSVFDENYEGERPIILYLDNFNISVKNNINPSPSNFNIIYPNNGDIFNLDTIINFQTIPFRWEESTDLDTIIYTNRMVAEIPTEDIPIADGFEDFEILQRVNPITNEFFDYKMPRGYSLNFWNGSGNYIQFQSDWSSYFSTWVTDSISKNGSHSLRMGHVNSIDKTHYTTLWLRLSQVADNLKKDRLQPGTKITVNGYLMTPSGDPLTGNNTATLGIYCQTGDWITSNSPVINSDSEPDIWHPFQVEMTIGENTYFPNTTNSGVLFKYNQFEGGSGSVYFDDVTVSTSKPMTYVVTNYFDATTSSTNTMMSASYLNNLFSFIKSDFSGLNFSEVNFKWSILSTDNISRVEALNSPITFTIIDSSQYGFQSLNTPVNNLNITPLSDGSLYENFPGELQ